MNRTSQTVLQSALVALVLTGLFSFTVGFASISDNCSTLLPIRGIGGNAGPGDVLERDYAPVCYANDYLPSCLPNNVPIYGGSVTNPQYGTFAPPAPICLSPYNLPVVGSVPEPRLRPKCPAGQDAQACIVGCVPSSGVFACSQLAGATPIPIYGQVTPTPGAAPTDAIPTDALPTLTPSPSAFPSATLSVSPTPSVIAQNAPTLKVTDWTKPAALFIVLFLVTFAAFQFWRSKRR